MRLLTINGRVGSDIVVEDESFLHTHQNFSEQNSDSDFSEHIRQLSSPQSKQHIMVSSFSSLNLSNNVPQEAKRAVPVKLFIVCYHLPLTITINESDTTADGEYRPFEIAWAESLIAKSGENSVASAMTTTWIGTVSVAKTLTEKEKAWLVDKLSDINCVAVFLQSEIARGAYKGFCKTIMWPVFHNVDQLDHIHAAWNLHSTSGNGSSGNLQAVKGKDQTSSNQIVGTLNPSSENYKAEANLENDKVVEWNKMGTEYYQAYKTMNEAFATALFSLTDANSENIVWVHDYHLMLLPSVLRKPPSELSGKPLVPIKVEKILALTYKI